MRNPDALKMLRDHRTTDPIFLDTRNSVWPDAAPTGQAVNRSSFKGLRAQLFRLLLVVIAGGVPAFAASANPMMDACRALPPADRESPPVTPVASEPSYPNILRVSQYLRRAELLGFTGGVGATQGGRVILRQAYGYSDRDGGRPMRPDSVFDIGSVTKQFTGAAILRLEEMGKLSTSDTLGRFFPDAPADKRDITIHQLLTHTAGLPHDAARRERLLSRQEGVATIFSVGLVSAPGAGYRYSNAGFTLLAAIVELASGERYEAFLRQHLWLPAGMRDTGNLLPGWSPDRFALGYNAAGSSPMPPTQWWIDDGPSWSARGAGYVLSTADDLLRWANALLSGRALSEASRRKLFHPHVSEGGRTPSYYGYGWVISRGGPDGSCVIAHDGGAGFHEDVLRIYPEQGLAAVFFTSESRSPASSYMARAAPLMFRSPDAFLPLSQVALSKGRLNELAGTYRADGVAIPVELLGRHLTIRSRTRGALRLLSAFPELTAADRNLVSEINPQVAGLFEALQRGDYAPLELLLRSGASIDEEKEFWPDQWRRWQTDMGTFRDTEIIGHRRVGDDLITYVQLHFARTSLPVEIFHDADGKINIGTVSVAFPERTFLLPRADGSFLAFNPRLGSVANLRLDSRTRALSITTKCAGRRICPNSS